MTEPDSERLLIGGRFDEVVPVEVLERGDGKIVLRVTFDDGHVNAAGMVHGGFIMAALDVTLAGAAASQPDSQERLYGITLSMTTNFVAPAPPGQLICRAGVTGGGRSTKFVDGRIEASPEPASTDVAAPTVYATATGTMRVVVLDES